MKCVLEKCLLLFTRMKCRCYHGFILNNCYKIVSVDSTTSCLQFRTTHHPLPFPPPNVRCTTNRNNLTSVRGRPSRLEINCTYMVARVVHVMLSCITEEIFFVSVLYYYHGPPFSLFFSRLIPKKV